MQSDYSLIREQYMQYGVDTEQAIKELQKLHPSLLCPSTEQMSCQKLTEFRHELAECFAMIPGEHRLTLQTSYNAQCDMKQLNQHYQSWIVWAQKHKVKLDLNVSCKSFDEKEGLTLSSPIYNVRNVFIEYIQWCCCLANEIGEMLQSVCHLRLSIHDYYGPYTTDRMLYQQLLKSSLDQVLAKKVPWCKVYIHISGMNQSLNSNYVLSHSFLIAYAVSSHQGLSIDFEKLSPYKNSLQWMSGMLLYIPEIMVCIEDILMGMEESESAESSLFESMCREIVRSGFFNRYHIQIQIKNAENLKAGVLQKSMRSMQMAYLHALLEPVSLMCNYENAGEPAEGISVLKQCEQLPWEKVFEEFCVKTSPII